MIQKARNKMIGVTLALLLVVSSSVGVGNNYKIKAE